MSRPAPQILTTEEVDAAIVAARSKGTPLGRVAKRFGVTRQAVLDAQERFNGRRKAGESAARAMAAVRPAPIVELVLEGEAPFLRAYQGKRGIAWRVDQKYEDDGKRRFRTIYDLGRQANREAATAAWEAARARGDKTVHLRPRKLKLKPPPPEWIALADLLTLQELAGRWGVPVAVASKHVRLHSLESIQVAVDPEARFKRSDVLDGRKGRRACSIRRRSRSPIRAERRGAGIHRGRRRTWTRS